MTWSGPGSRKRPTRPAVPVSAPGSTRDWRPRDSVCGASPAASPAATTTTPASSLAAPGRRSGRSRVRSTRSSRPAARVRSRRTSSAAAGSSSAQRSGRRSASSAAFSALAWAPRASRPRARSRAERSRRSGRQSATTAPAPRARAVTSGHDPAHARPRLRGAEGQRRREHHAAAGSQQRRGAVGRRAPARPPQQALQVLVDQVAGHRVSHGVLVQGRVSAYIKTLTAMRAAASRTGGGSPWTSGSSSPSPMSLDQV